MTDNKMELGIVGLGKMGGNLAMQALEKGMRVVGLTLGNSPEELLEKGLIEAKDPSGMKDHLDPPRKVFMYIPAGAPVDALIDDLAAVLDAGDILIDGGNSYWGDSIRRHARLREKGLSFIDLGTSGGIDGARNGACFMAGGEGSAVKQIEPVVMALAVPGGYVHAGPPGAGHFVKLVHNGIEFGMLQAIGEGMDLLSHYREDLHIADIVRCWRHGSVIRSWLIDLMDEAYRKEGGFEHVPAFIEDTGEVNWLIDDAMRMEVPVPVMAQAVMQLFASRDHKKHWARSVAMMRHGFGGHPYGPDGAVRRERRRGRIGGFIYNDEEQTAPKSGV